MKIDRLHENCTEQRTGGVSPLAPTNGSASFGRANHWEIDIGFHNVVEQIRAKILGHQFVPILRRTAMMRAGPAGFKAMNEEIRARAEQQDASLNGKTTGGR